jgi:hypothetical protein
LNGTGLGFFWKNTTGGFFDGKTFRKQSNPFAINGVPDVLGILKGGRFIAFEIKSEKGKTSQAQESFIRKAQELGALVFVVRSVREAALALESLAVDASRQSLSLPI